MLVPIQVPPGVYANGTDMQGAGRWREANLVRWHAGSMRPIGGWIGWGSASITGIARGAHAWKDNSGNVYLATGDNDGLFVFTDQDTLGTLTPSGLTAGQVDGSGAIGGSSGYGEGDYGSSYYGTLVFAGTGSEATVWSLDNWGENLIACNAADGAIYEWSPPTAGAISAISGAPTSCVGIVVTPERFLFGLGAGGNPRKLQWSDREDNGTWTATATNEAGDFLLETPGEIVTAVTARGQTLIATTVDLWVANYLGPPLVYGFERVGVGCGTISRAAMAPFSEGVAWMGESAFYVYDGTVSQIPCEVRDHVFDDLNVVQRSKVWACDNSEWNEVWWFYPSSSANEIDRYVAWNYVENHWTVGELSRTAGVGRGAFPQPIWIDASGDPYIHERGQNRTGTAYAETGPLVVQGGESVVSATRLHPDEATQGDVTATFKTRLGPNGTETSHGPYTLTQPTSVRFTGRQFRLRVDEAEASSWRVGVPRLEVHPRGRR